MMRKKTNLLLGLFVAALIISNVVGAKITEFDVPRFISAPLNILFLPLIYVFREFLLMIGGREIPFNFFDTFHVSVGILTVPVMFLITDIIEEIYGKKKVKEFIVAGVAAMSFLIVVTTIAVELPSAARSSIEHETFSQIFKVSRRMAIASILAFVIAQIHDMWSFDFWKRKTKGRYLWLRNNLSTFVSQLIDSTIFMFVAFYKSAPMWDAVFIISLIIPYWMFKILFALIDTPIAYLGVAWMRKGQRK